MACEARSKMWRGLNSMSGAAVVAPLARADPPGNTRGAALAGFSDRVTAYVKLHRSVAKEDAALKPTNSPEELRGRVLSLRRRIVSKRGPVLQGNIFTSEISEEFRRLAGISMEGGN